MINMNWKSFLLLIAAIVVVNFVGNQLGRHAAENDNTREIASARSSLGSQEIQIIVTSQDAEGATQEQMDLVFLNNLETYTVERVKVKTKEYLASIGRPNVTVDLTSGATYVKSGPVKLAVIRMDAAGTRHVIIAGIVGREFKRVTCIRMSANAIPISYGQCGDKIREVFGVSIGG